MGIPTPNFSLFKFFCIIGFGMKRILYPLIIRLLKKTTQIVLNRCNPLIVAVTGSVGKSSFIYLLDSLVKDRFKVKTTFSGNSESGLPLEILGLRKFLASNSAFDWLIIAFALPFVLLFSKFDFKVLIAELSIDSLKPPKNMSYLLEFIKPRIAVFLSVAPAHTQQFSQHLNTQVIETEKILENIAKEKGKIVTHLDSSSYAVINVDSPYIRKLIPQIRAKLVTLGKNHSAAYRLLNYRLFTASTSYIFSYKGLKKELKIRNAVLSEEFGLVILAVVATADILGITFNEALRLVEKRFVLPPGRMSLLHGKMGIKIIDGSYNSSPVALKSSLNTLIKLPALGDKIAILGDMRELGPLQEKSHSELAALISKAAQRVYLVGPLMRKYLYPKLTKLKIPVETFPISLGLGDYILKQKILKKGDVVFVKGSQNEIFLEQTVLELLDNPQENRQHLCRQSEYWDKKRAGFFNRKTHE